MSDPQTPNALFRVAQLARRKPTRFRFDPDSAGRARIAADLGIQAILRLDFAGEIVPAGRDDWTLTARLLAEVEQACVVTLAPVRSTITEDVLRRYIADLPEPAAEEIEMPEDDTIEALPETIDAGAVMIEALALALPPWPRAPGAGLAPPDTGDDAAGTNRIKPFARLAELLKKPGGDPA